MPISSVGHPGYSCFWQPRQDAANLINYLLTRGHRYLPSGATGCKTSSPLPRKLMLPPTQECQLALSGTLTASSSNSARPSSSRQPGNLGRKGSPSSPRGHMPPAAKADAANLTTYLLIRGHRYLPSGGTGCKTPSLPAPAWTLQLMLPPTRNAN